jgi:hypothetical protein
LLWWLLTRLVFVLAVLILSPLMIKNSLHRLAIIGAISGHIRLCSGLAGCLLRLLLACSRTGLALLGWTFAARLVPNRS